MTMHPSEDQARELMSAWARDQTPSAEVRERTWMAVQARASAGELGPELEPEPGSLTATVVSTGARLRLLLVGLGVAAVVGGIALQRARNDPTEAPADPAPVVEPEHEVAPPSIEPSEEPPLVAPVEAQPDPPPADVGEPLSRPRAAAHKRPSARVDPPPTSEIDPLTIEMELLGAARTALKSGDFDAALDHLDEHARRFPDGALRSERELSRITVLCKADRRDAAETTARRFIAAHPGSTQAKRLHDTCIGDRL